MKFTCICTSIHKALSPQCPLTAVCKHPHPYTHLRSQILSIAMNTQAWGHNTLALSLNLAWMQTDAPPSQTHLRRGNSQPDTNSPFSPNIKLLTQRGRCGGSEFQPQEGHPRSPLSSLCTLGVRMARCSPTLQPCQPGHCVPSLADVCPAPGN